MDYNNRTYGSREVVDFVAVDYASKTPYISVPWANTTAVDMTGETTYAYGGQGHPKLIAYHGDRGGTFKFETQIQTMKLYSMITGSDIQSGAALPEFLRREEVDATGSGAFSVSKTPVDGSINVFQADDDCGTPITGTISVEGLNVTVTNPAPAFVEGDKLVVYYLTAYTSQDVGARGITVTAKTFPKYFILYGNTVEICEDGEAVSMKLIAYKAAPQPAFTVNFANSGDPATLSVTCDLLADDGGNILSLINDDETTE